MTRAMLGAGLRGGGRWRLGLLCSSAALVAAPRALQPQQQQQSPLRAIPVQTGAVVDRDSVTVGDVVRLTVRVRAPLGATISFPAAVDSLGPVQSLAPPTVRDGADSATAADRVATYRLAAWDIGHQVVRLGDVLVQTDDGERRVALALPTLVVRTVLPADTALRVPRPARPLLAPPAPTPWWWWALAGAVVAMLGALVWWQWRRRRTVAAVPDAYADARASFGRVERLRLVDAGEPGRHVALMTDVLRRYLAERFERASLAQTSGELLVTLGGAPTVSHEALRALLDEVDPVKFAAAPLAVDRARVLGEAAKEMVREEHTRAAAAAAAQPDDSERAA